MVVARTLLYLISLGTRRCPNCSENILIVDFDDHSSSCAPKVTIVYNGQLPKCTCAFIMIFGGVGFV